jgi:hypothetical protein
MSGARAGMWEADGAGCKSLPRGLPFPVGVAVSLKPPNPESASQSGFEKSELNDCNAGVPSVQAPCFSSNKLQL